MTSYIKILHTIYKINSCTAPPAIRIYKPLVTGSLESLPRDSYSVNLSRFVQQHLPLYKRVETANSKTSIWI